MAQKQNEKTAEEMWTYFQSVISWVKLLFPNYRKEMKGIQWGLYYNKYKAKPFSPIKLEKKVVELMLDEDATRKRGYMSIYWMNKKNT